MRAAFSNTGQLCISMERMYVADAIWDDFVPRFVAATRELRLGHSLRYDADLGSLISAAQLDTVTRHVDDAVGKGATVLAGGRARPDIGPYFYEPTILTGVAPGICLRRGDVRAGDLRVPGRGPDEAVGWPTTAGTG